MTLCIFHHPTKTLIADNCVTTRRKNTNGDPVKVTSEMTKLVILESKIFLEDDVGHALAAVVSGDINSAEKLLTAVTVDYKHSIAIRDLTIEQNDRSKDKTLSVLLNIDGLTAGATANVIVVCERGIHAWEIATDRHGVIRKFDQKAGLYADDYKGGLAIGSGHEDARFLMRTLGVGPVEAFSCVAAQVESVSRTYDKLTLVPVEGSDTDYRIGEVTYRNPPLSESVSELRRQVVASMRDEYTSWSKMCDSKITEREVPRVMSVRVYEAIKAAKEQKAVTEAPVAPETVPAASPVRRRKIRVRKPKPLLS